MNTVSRADSAIRFQSPEMAAGKLGWTLARVLKRRDALGIGPFVGRRNAWPKPKAKAKVAGKKASGKANDRKPAKRLAAAGA